MPLYKYKCTSCNNRFKEIKNGDNKEVAECPNCGEEATRQIPSNFATRYKGKGFYSTKDKETQDDE